MSKHMGSGPGGQRPIEGWRQSEKEKHVDEPPPEEEFKKIMEVESATEAPQKRKRREMEGAEEIEGLNVPERTIETPVDKQPSPFEIQAPKSLKKETYSGQKHAEMTFLPEDEMAVEPESFTSELPQEEPAPQMPTPQMPPPQTPTAPAPKTQTPQPEPEATTPTPQVEEPQKPQPQQPSDQGQQQPSDQEQKPATQKPPVEGKPTPIQKPLTEEPAKAATTIPEPKKPTVPEAKKGVPKAATRIEEPTKTPPEEIAKIQKEKREKQAEEKVAETATTAPTHVPEGMPTPTPAVEGPPPSYLNLPPAVFELFDRMVSLITIKHEQGIETATVHIDMKGSIFNGSTLTLKRDLETGPNRFDIELQSSPEGMHLFNSNMDDLIAAFRHGKYNFDVNIRPATLSKEYRAKTRRVTRKEDTEKGA